MRTSRRSPGTASDSLAVSYEGVVVRYSAAGDRWEPAHKVPPLDTLHDVAWGSGRIVAVGRNGDHRRQSMTGPGRTTSC